LITEAFPIAATVLLPIILFPLSGGMVLSSKTAAFRSGYLKIPDMVSKGIILNISLIAVMVYLILHFFWKLIYSLFLRYYYLKSLTQ